MAEADPAADAGPVPRPTEGEWELQPDSTVPYYKFPPWPILPEGRTLLTYAEFQARGYKPVTVIDVDPRVVELDASGVPTTMLEVIHDTTNTKKKKRKKGGARAVAGRSIFDQWAEVTASLGGRYPVLDPNDDPTDRLETALADFQSAYPWNSELQSVADNFKTFIGRIGNPNQLLSHRKTNPKKTQPGDAAEISDDEGDDEDIPMVDANVATAATTTENGEAAASSDAPGTEGENEPRIPDDPIQKVYDEMLHRFLTEPERAVKIFLSSYFINKGLYWQANRQRMGPLFMQALVSYLLRRNALGPDPAIRRSLERALHLADLATKELPMTRTVCQALSPERFADVCVKEFGQVLEDGRVTKEFGDGFFPLPTALDAKAQVPEPEVEVVVVESGETQRERTEFGQVMAELDPNAVMVVDADAPPAAADVPPGVGWSTQDAPGATGGGWSGQDAPATTAWANNPDAMSGAWSAEDYTVGSGAPAPMDWSSIPSIKIPTFNEWVGIDPSTLVVHRAEDSTRRIVRIIPPAPNNPSVLGPAKNLVGIVLGHWPASGSNDIPSPRMLLDKGAEGEFKPGESEITVYVNPDALPSLVDAVGLGLLGVWVQVMPKAEEAPAPVPAPSTDAKPKRKKTKKAGAQGWWYAQKVCGGWVSFWEEDELEDAIARAGGGAGDDADDGTV